jgi:RNA polymerase sigma-70 factor (ECF subfamily)
MSSAEFEAGSSVKRRFATTHWSVVAAARDSHNPEAKEALALLCGTYWYPLYAFIRRQGYSAEETQDLTQGFFAWLLERQALKSVDRERGRFRSFILVACKHYLSHERERRQAKKRGGGRTHFSLSFEEGETRYGTEPSHNVTAERLFMRRWAMTLLEQVLSRLRNEFAEKDKAETFDGLRLFLLGESSSQSHAQAAKELGMTEGAVRVAVHRLRRRFRELMREEIGRTVAAPEHVEDEVRELFAALAPEKRSTQL